MASIELSDDCVLCGAPVDTVDGDTCSFECMGALSALSDAEFPIALGHAVRRFVRAAEVEGLRAVLASRIDRAMCDEDCFCGRQRALDRLCELAKEAP